MSYQIQNHAHALRAFLLKLKENRNIKICDYRENGYESYIFWRIKLSGKEDRPFTNEEIQEVLYQYRYFKDYFTKQGLWILPAESLPEKEEEGESDVQKKAIDFRRNHQKLLSALLEKGYEGLTDEEKRYWNSVY